MSMVSSLFGITKHVLSIVDTKTSRKYLDEVIKLEQRYYDELKKPEHKRNHAAMDNAVNRLCLIADTSSRFGKEGIKD